MIPREGACPACGRALEDRPAAPAGRVATPEEEQFLRRRCQGDRTVLWTGTELLPGVRGLRPDDYRAAFELLAEFREGCVAPPAGLRAYRDLDAPEQARFLARPLIDDLRDHFRRAGETPAEAARSLRPFEEERD